MRVPVGSGRQGLALEGDWPRRWTVTWRANEAEVSCPVRDLVQMPWLNSDPIRGFSWRRDQRHRPGLMFWSLGEEAWAEIINQLPPVPGPVQPTLDDRKRQEASAFILARVTQGAPRFAPRPIEAQQPQHTQREWLQRRGNTWHHFNREAPLAHYGALKNLLVHHADLLAATTGLISSEPAERFG
ncbi:hypothetical protein GCM10022224_019070 [Nonomuraea antimicrobica]|uniref:Uncharacterized protein n=1 Tax=Nonomuraea antimicrobica TaxID=561173 RepID=A0ABP7BDL5_9ACTN